MKVLDLRCAHGHAFEGWFASEDDYTRQLERGLVECPLCGDKAIHRLPSAPRLNLGAAAPAQVPASAAPSAATTAVATPTPEAAALQRAWMEAMQQVLASTEDVGASFPEEARRIHYGEAEARGIRGQASPQERQALAEEGIETVALPLPQPFKGTTH